MAVETLPPTPGPAPRPPVLPPLLVTDAQRRQDDEHIRLLWVFHFIVSGLALLGIAFLFLHYLMMSTFFLHPERWNTRGGNVPPREFFNIFIWFYVFMGVVLLVASVGNLISAVFLRWRKHRTFSLVVAGLDCVQIPFGTALGVFTLIVLLRDSVRQSYEASPLGLGRSG